MERFYIYAVISGGGSPPGLKGLDDEPVELIAAGDLAAAVSRTSREGFSGLEQAALLPLAARHQEVNQALLAVTSLVPFRFGMIAASRDELRKTVSSLYLQLKAALRRVARKVELAVQASWDHARVTAACAQGDGEVAALREEFARSPSPALQVEVGKRLFALVEEQRRKGVASILSPLTPIASAVTLHRLQNPGMVLNGAFLVEKDREGEFDRAVQEVAERQAGKLELKYIGPLPPYSFCDLELGSTPREALDAARTTLELPEQASLGDVKDAYRRLSREFHPDRGSADPWAYQRYQEIVAAYDLLTTYCESYVHCLAIEECRDDLVPATAFQATG